MVETGISLMEGFHRQITGAVKGVEERLAALTREAEQEAVVDESKRAELLADLQTGRDFLEGLPSPEDYRLPHQTFTDELVLRGGGRTVPATW